jgi:hypothetical protein
MSYLAELKTGKDNHAKRLLECLYQTLDYFEVSKKDRDSVAEALLRFRVFKDQVLKFDDNDPMLAKFLELDYYLTQLLIPKQNVEGKKRLTTLELQSISTNHLFHRLWTKSVGSSDYDKKEWVELEKRLTHVSPEKEVSENFF